MCPSELGRHSSDQPGEAPELQRAPEMTYAQREAYAKNVMDALDKHRTDEREKSIAAAAERGIGKEQWEEYQRLGQEDGRQAGRIEESQYRLREGPPNYHGTRPVTDTEKQEYVDKYKAQQREALEHFRTEPAEGADNKPIDAERTRPWVHWRSGDRPFEPGELNRRDAAVYVRDDRRDSQDPRTGLREPEAMPDPRLTPEQHAAKIEQQRGQAAEVMGARRWSNSKHAGEVYQAPEYLRERFPDGVQFSDEGFPQFDRYSSKTVMFLEGFRGPRKKDDFNRANEIFGWKNVPDSKVWHHTEDGRTMVLIDRELHDEVRHWGGVRASKQMGLWEGDN